MRTSLSIVIIGAVVLSFNGALYAGGKMTEPQSPKIAIGQDAPEFSLLSEKGVPVALSSFRGSKVVVLFFYPKDNTAICTKEACLFRDAYDDFVEHGATVIGVSSDDVQSHDNFAKDNSLQFLLLADAGGEVRKRYQVKSTLGIIPGRVTFVIDKAGVIRHMFGSQLDASKHVSEAMNWVKKLVAQDASQNPGHDPSSHRR